MPLPEAVRGGFRPGLKERAWSGLPPWGKGKTSPMRPSRDLNEEIREQVQAQDALMDLHLHMLHHFSQQASETDHDKGRPKPAQRPGDAVKRLLGRELTLAEQILVAQMHRRGKKPVEMAAILRGLKPGAP